MNNYMQDFKFNIGERVYKRTGLNANNLENWMSGVIGQRKLIVENYITYRGEESTTVEHKYRFYPDSIGKKPVWVSEYLLFNEEGKNKLILETRKKQAYIAEQKWLKAQERLKQLTEG